MVLNKTKEFIHYVKNAIFIKKAIVKILKYDNICAEKGVTSMNDDAMKDSNLYKAIKNDLRDMTEDESTFYINMLLEDYERRKKENRLYETNDPIPKIIIRSYYECLESLDFETLVKHFRRKYILNENKVESVHEQEEREGLGLVYEYIQNYTDVKNLNIYTLLRIHQILYSKVPFPEFGGKFRTDSRFLPGSGTETTNYDLIPNEMAKLFFPVQELIKEGVELAQHKTIEKIIPYIDKCIELKCKLIKIHPFGDGNGRSIRAFINLLFKIADIPPIYIKNKEKFEYTKAMHLGVNENNLEYIKTFYYYKVCDSIIELDINYNEDKVFAEQLKEESKKL